MNDKDEKYDVQDEGEYHFSDEHVAYEVDTDTLKVSDSSNLRTSSITAFDKFRRPAIAVAVFFSLMFVVYKVITPNSTAPIGEISQAKALTPSLAEKNITHLKPAGVVPIASASGAPAPAAPPAAAFSPPTSMPAVVAATPVSTVQPNVQQQPPQLGAVQYDANKEVLDRLASLEQQNAKLTNIMQIEYAQRLTDFENQVAASQAKLKELNARIAGMEAMAGPGRQQASLPAREPPAARSSQPKQIYTVQAIIPGRAWLKSDAGDTITVAEGDVLRDYGRVTKIDPYDGVVNIDTGNKMVSLSYGSSGD